MRRAVISWAATAACLSLATAFGPARADPAADAQNNKMLVRRFMDAVAQGDMTTFNALTEPTAITHGSTGDRVRGGPYADIAQACAICAVIPDRSVVIEYILAEGDLVTVRSKMTGHYTGRYREIEVSPPKAVTVVYTNTYRIAGGKIVENWFSTDRLSLAEQLGFKLSPPTSVP